MTPDQKMEIEKMRAAAMARQGEIETAEDEMYSAASPKGRFTGKGANALVDATNRLLPLFGISDKYDRFGSEPMTSLPPEFVRILTMFSKAIADAVDAGILPEDATIDMKIVSDDSGLQSMAGRIGMAAKSPQFKRFLMRKITEKGAGEMKEGEYGPETESESEGEGSGSEMDTESLFKSRM